VEKKGNIYTKEAVARILGISERRVGQLAKDGIIEEHSPGHFKLLPAVHGYIRYLHEQIETKSKKTELDAEKEKLARIKRKSAEIDLEIKRNELHRAADVEFIMGNMLAAFKAKLETLPHKALPPLLNTPADMDRREHILETLTALVGEALGELVEYDPKAYEKGGK